MSPREDLGQGRVRGRRKECGVIALRGVGAVLLVAGLSACSGSTTGAPPAPGIGEGTQGATYEPGTRMADVELAAPSVSELFLRATLPVPPYTYPREPGIDLFSFVSPTGEHFPAQTEIVTRYAAPEQGADVVEVLSRVRVPAGTPPGERLSFAIVWNRHPRTPLELAPAVEGLLATPGSLTARTRDVFGHVYGADLLEAVRQGSPSLRTFRDGTHVRQVRAHELLLPHSPVAGPQGTLPHLMGIHAYVTLYDREELLGLDLRVHNGASGLSPFTPLDDPLNDLYFDELRLQLPAGWRVLSAFRDPFLGDPIVEGSRVGWPVVKPLEGGGLHLMPAQAQFERRLIVCRDDPETIARARAVLLEEGLAFVRRTSSGSAGEKWSWWNPETPGYFPQRLRLPDLGFLGDDTAVRAELESRFDAHLAALVSGKIGPWPIVQEVLGWCHPWGPAFGAMHGGSEIFLFDGLRTASSASREGYRLHQLTQRMYVCRQPVALYEADGEESRVEHWVRTEPEVATYLPVWVFLRPVLFLGDPHGFGHAPTFQQEAVVQQGREPYYAELLREYQPIDIQHLVRLTRSAKTLAWLGNDALAKDDLRMHAELLRLSYSQLPQKVDGSAIVTGMYADEEYVASHPRQGLGVDRGEGWLLDTVAAAYRLADPTWRAEVHPWLAEVVELFAAGQEECSGVIGSVPNDNWFDSQYRCRQSISAAILEHGLQGLRASVFEGRDDARRGLLDQLLAKSCHAMIAPEYWNPDESAPYFLVATGPHDTDLPGFCGVVPRDGTMGSDSYQTWCSFAWGFRLTGDSEYLTRATEMAGGDLWGALEKPGLGELENRAALLLLWQELHGY